MNFTDIFAKYFKVTEVIGSTLKQKIRGWILLIEIELKVSQLFSVRSYFCGHSTEDIAFVIEAG